MTISIRRLTEKDLQELKEAEFLFQSTGAWGNLQNDALKFFCQSPTSVVFGAFDNEKLIGSSVAALLGERQFEFFQSYGSVIEDKVHTTKIAHLIGAVLGDAYRGQGIGQKLLKARLDWAREVGAKWAISNSWGRKQRFNSARLFEADGFQEVTRFTNFTPQIKVSCPSCGEDCRCENIIFLKEI